MRRHALLLGLVFSAALTPGLASCGDDNNESSATPTQPASAASPQPTKASGDLILATTTSTQDSGLLDILVPKFEQESGYTVKVVAVGSGQAIEQASRGDADVVLAHSPAAEKKMVDEGNGVSRVLVMHNDFILVGPASDPAGVKPTATINDAMTAISSKGVKFISRGDDSGTNALELKLWKDVSIDPSGQDWYEETGQGMGATLQVANQKNGYTISDRATYLAQKSSLDLVILHEGDGSLLNYYHVIVVNKDKHPDINAAGAQAFADFMVRDDIQELIGKFGVDKFGQQLFVPDAGKQDPTAYVAPENLLVWI